MKSRRWGDLCKLNYGRALRDYPGEPSEEEPFRVFGTNGPIGWTGQPLCEEAGIIIGRKGAYRGVHFSSEPFFVIDTAYYFEPTSGEIDLKWAYYKLLTVDINRMDVGAAIPTTNRDEFYALEVTYPELPAQKKTADILAAYDDLIENNRRRMALLEEAARQLYREWFVRFRFPGHEHTRITNGVPEGWDLGTIADFFDTTSGGTPSRSNPDFYTGDINWVKTQELNDDFIFETEERVTEDALARSSAKLFPANTLLVSIYGGTNIGRTGILAEQAATNQACCALFPRDPRAHFIYGALYFREQREHLIGLAQGAAQTNISQRVIRSLPIRMATPSLMSMFVASLLPVFEQMKTLKQQTLKIRAARDLLLPRLMSGVIAA